MAARNPAVARATPRLGGGTDSHLIGGDCLVYIPPTPDSSSRRISRATSATAPLALLVGSDGHMKFKAVSAQFLNAGANATGVTDIVPRAGRSPGIVQ